MEGLVVIEETIKRYFGRGVGDLADSVKGGEDHVVDAGDWK